MTAAADIFTAPAGSGGVMPAVMGGKWRPLNVPRKYLCLLIPNRQYLTAFVPFSKNSRISFYNSTEAEIGVEGRFAAVNLRWVRNR